MNTFILESEFSPKGDQRQVIDALTEGGHAGKRHQVLLGVTGSGKTFTMANVIAKVQKPTLVVVHNKTLAAQLYQEFKCFFPHNAVEYFVSYYDYYQPEAYIPSTDTYIAKDASINDTIDQMRHAATRPGDGKLKDRGCATVSIQRKMLAITARRRHPSCHNVRDSSRLTHESSHACGCHV